MQIFIIKPKRPCYNENCRTSFYHRAVYHGTGERPDTLNNQWRPPALNNHNREALAIRRSGLFVPRVSMPNELVVDHRIKQRLEQLSGTGFLQVRFEKLVSLKLPRIGDFSWYKQRINQLPEPDPVAEFEVHADVAHFHESIGPFWEVLSANLYEQLHRPADAQGIIPEYGTYSGEDRPEPVLVSQSLLREYPVTWGGEITLRRDAFRRIARHLNLDYFDISIHELDDVE